MVCLFICLLGCLLDMCVSCLVWFMCFLSLFVFYVFPVCFFFFFVCSVCLLGSRAHEVGPGRRMGKTLLGKQCSESRTGSQAFAVYSKRLHSTKTSLFLLALPGRQQGSTQFSAQSKSTFSPVGFPFDPLWAKVPKGQPLFLGDFGGPFSYRLLI